MINVIKSAGRNAIINLEISGEDEARGGDVGEEHTEPDHGHKVNEAVPHGVTC